MSITLRQVEVFVAIADHLHFGRAADSLLVAQATVSQELKRLEVALRLQLVTRTTRTAVLTPAGEAVLADARALLDAAQLLQDRSKLFREEHLHRVRIVASPSAINELVPAVIKSTEELHPEISIEEIGVDSGSVMHTMQKLTADIALGRFLETPPRFVKETIAFEEFYVAISEAHPLARSEVIDLKQFTELPLLLWSREQAPRYYDALLEICSSRGLAPMVLLSPPRIVGSRSYLLREGKAFALVPRSAVDSLPSEVKALPIAEAATLPLDLVYRDQDPRAAVNDVVETIRKTAKLLK